MEKKYIRISFIGCLIFILCLMGVSYYRVIKEVEKLAFKLEEYEYIINASNDRLRLIFAKHQEDFSCISQYIVRNYDEAFFIEYRDNSIFIDYKKVDDSKLLDLFRILKEELISFYSDSNNRKMSVVNSKNEFLGGYEIIFELQTGNAGNRGSYAFIKYEDPNELMLNQANSANHNFEYTYVVIQPHWKSRAEYYYRTPTPWFGGGCI